jgi:hypothetical protein
MEKDTKDAEGNPVSVTDIVQITDSKHHWFPTLIVVTELKGWGVMGYHVLVNNDPDTTNGLAFIRLKSDEFMVVGRAEMYRHDEEE